MSSSSKKKVDDLTNKWTVTSEGQAIERQFKFKTFAKAWDFMTAVSLQCKVKNHHPEWSNTYNHVFIRWTTHNPPGLSDNDISLASICDELAENFGVLEETRGGDDKECQLRAIADKAASTAGDCCAPSK